MQKVNNTFQFLCARVAKIFNFFVCWYSREGNIRSKYSTLKKIIYLFLAVLGLRCCMQAFFTFYFLLFFFRLSLVATSGGYSSLWCVGFSLQWLLLLRSVGSRRTGFSSCGTWAQQLWLMGPRVQAQQLWRMGLVAPWHVGSSQTRAQTCVPCIVRWVLLFFKVTLFFFN